MSADNQPYEPQRDPAQETLEAESRALLANYPPPPPASETQIPVLELKWPSPLGWMTLAEYNRRRGVSAALFAHRSAQPLQKN